MLTLLISRAGTGKTDYIMQEIKRKMGEGETGMLLIVPEQYSHDAERQLCFVCGDSLSLYAEVVSFTRLYNNIVSELGKGTLKPLDKSGQIIAFHRAVEAVAPKLKAFGLKRMRTEILERLQAAVGEFKSYNITADMLSDAAEKTDNPLSDKLHDLALICSAYDSLLKQHGSDAAERLSILAELIKDSKTGTNGHIYFDGFNDFTAQELTIIGELMKKKSNITICLSCDLDDFSEVFEVPRKTVAQLYTLAKKNNYPIESKENKETLTSHESLLSHTPELKFLEQELFTDAPKEYKKASDAIVIYSAPSKYVECEYAAYEVLKLIRDGYRWRDVAIMARNLEDYSAICENVFEKYEIPYFSSGKTDILSKQPVALLDCALEIAASGFEYKSIFRYLKTGLIDISTDECAILENYAIKWQVRGTLWTYRWTMPPHGYGNSTDHDKETLDEINEIRERVINPLIKLKNNLKGETIINEKLRVLYSFMEDIGLYSTLNLKSDELILRNRKHLADEYKQLWDIIISAMEQMNTILEDEKFTAGEFHKLLILALSQNDVGVIPISLDRTPLGGMAMSRRRNIKCLIILGATDDNMPSLGKNSGALSDNEKTILGNLGAKIPAGLEDKLNREMNMIYSVLTLPSKRLILIYSPETGHRPSFIVKRLQEMYNITEKILSPDEYKTLSKIPFDELNLEEPPYIVERQKQNLSENSAKSLYGEKLKLSATGVDSYYSCPYMFFLKRGLKVNPRKKAEFDALTAGNFMHYVLDGVFTEVKSTVGFKNIDDKQGISLTEKYITKFINDVLLNFDGKNSRFTYLFDRYKADVKFVVLDMLNELKNSSFEPLDLELDMSTLSETQRGFIDRVDGFEHEGKLYLRVIDYKTRKAAYSFNMTDILNGKDLQMLIYMFSLMKYGGEKYGKSIEPAGVLYVPARDNILSVSPDVTEEEIANLRRKEMCRSGLILNNPTIIDAMENGETKNYLPVKTNKDGIMTGNSLVTSEEFILLNEHVEQMLAGAKDNIQTGKNDCVPYYKSENDNACNYCDYHTICTFGEEIGDKHRYIGKMENEEIWDTLREKHGRNN